MRRAFLCVDRRSEAAYQCPWACDIVRVSGGFMCFESHAAYLTWRAQR